MRRHVSIGLVLGLIGWLGVNTSCAQSISGTELQERVKAHINERMYDCCRSVTLTKKADGVYEGFALLLNGVRSGLEVRVSGRDIAYTFVRSAPPAGEREQSGPENIQPSHASLEELETIVRQQETEIARLDELCRQAGIDPQAPPVPPADESPRDTPEPSAAKATFTSSMYTQIRKGMTYRQVVDALGTRGEQIGSSYFDGAANEVYVWVNLDDSHICVVFRDGIVLVKAQSGLPGIAPLPRSQADQDESLEFTRFRNWQLAQEADGRLALLGLSLSQWLDKTSTHLADGSPGEPARIEIVEQDDGLAIKLAQHSPQYGTRDTIFHLTCVPPENASPDLPAGMEIETLCVPSGMTIDGKESGPAQAWKAMTELAGLNADGQGRPADR